MRLPAHPRPTNATAVTNGFDCATLDEAFVPTGYLGAFDPNGPSWLTARGSRLGPTDIGIR